MELFGKTIKYKKYFKVSSVVLTALIPLVLLLLLYACSTKPSETDAKKVYENLWKDEIKRGEFKINSFKKINAQSGEVFGVKVYVIEVEAEIEYSSKDIPGGSLTTARNKGKIKKIKRELKFEKTEKGWQGEDEKIY